MKTILIIALLIVVVALFAVTNAWLLKHVNRPKTPSRRDRSNLDEKERR